jgi:two-component system chemotaxis response regulator CheB
MKLVRVLVVDDSAYSRRVISRMLETVAGVEVVGYATDGEDGIRQVIALKPDLVTIDLEMPKMDGFTLLRILRERFNLPVIVISALGDAEKMFKALDMGAFDFVVKPTQEVSEELLSIESDLKLKVRQALTARIRQRTMTAVANDRHHGRLNILKGIKKPSVDLVAIASSTGGPPALQNILCAFEQAYPIAFVVAQHMPPGFTKAFADRLNRHCQFEVREATDMDLVKPGCVLIGPGGKNMLLERSGADTVVRIVEPAPEYRYIPSADLLFTSSAKIFGKRMLAVVLTGMGNDGSQGVVSVSEHGGMILAESEETAVVYGMPREAVATGKVDRIVPLQDMPREILACGGFEP